MNTNIDFIYDYTEDGLRLQGTHFEPQEKDICVILTHGMCGTIIDNYFATIWGKCLANNNIGFLYGHNRGYSIENDIVMKDGTLKRYGCMYEIFEECIFDIDLWIKKAKELGYKRIILAGHSYGCNKIIYYYYKKKPDILGMVLASAPDMSFSDKDHEVLIKEAKENVENNKPMKILHKMVDNYMYFSSQTYYNWYQENSNVDNLPVVRNPEKWDQFSKIDIPILTFSGSNEEKWYLQLELLKEKALSCPNFTFEIIENTGHTYKDCEKQTGKLIAKWIKEQYL